jgi:hypothetical protein
VNELNIGLREEFFFSQIGENHVDGLIMVSFYEFFLLSGFSFKCLVFLL